MFEETKFITKDELLIFLIAMEASDGIVGDSSMILRAKSFMDRTTALKSLLDDFFSK